MKSNGRKMKPAGMGRRWATAVMATGWVACGVDPVSQEPASEQVSLAVETAGVCEVVPPFSPNFEPELEWEWTGSSVLPNHKQVMMTPVVADVNQDGTPDVIFNSFVGSQYSSDGVMRAVDGASGFTLWTVTNPAHRVRGAASIAAGDIDKDGEVELCTIHETGNGVICFEHDGTFKFRTSGTTNNWGSPSFADLDGDGNVEIINGRHVFTHTGALKWAGANLPGGSQGPLAFAADIDGDGKLEVIDGRSQYRHDGTLKCSNISVSVPNGLAGVGNFDADPRGEVVVVGTGKVSLLDDNCALLWQTDLPGGGSGGAPNIADFDNDGQPEIGVAGSTRYSVFETNGTVKWSSPTQDASSHQTGSSTFDFEGDGKAEVVYGDETRLRIYDGATGAVRFSVPHSSGTAYENPVIVDVDADNNAEIVIASNNYAFPGVAGIRVFRDKKDGWVNTRRIWNQHAYAVTNINEDGTIPAHPVTNWLTSGLNTFRSNSQGSGSTSPFAAADIVVSNLYAGCTPGEATLTISADVTNQGLAAASSGLNVAFYKGNPKTGGALLGVASVLGVLAPGASTTVMIDLNPAPGGMDEIFVVADDDGTGVGRELECREDNNVDSKSLRLACTEPTCIEVRLSDYNLFLLEDYNLGTDVEGKVAAGGNITMNNFAVGSRLPDNDTANTLVAGGNLHLTNGGVWGDAWYGGTYNNDITVSFPRGVAAQGAPINFAARGAQLRQLSAELNGLAVNGTTTKETWGGIYLRGTDPSVNVYQVDGSAFTGAVLLNIEAPAGSLAVINISGPAARFTNFGIQFAGGIDQHGVLFNFTEATSIYSRGFGFWGTVLAPYAHVDFSEGSWDGGMYAKSLTGYAEGHINPLWDRDICQ